MSATAYPFPLPTQTLAPPPIVSRARTAFAIDPGRLFLNAVLVVALLSLNTLGSAGSVVFFGILVVMILRSPEAAFKALAICYLGLMINTVFVPKTIVWTFGRLIIPYLALLQFLTVPAALRHSLVSRGSYVALLFFVMVMAVCSIASGWYTHIALLKLANFFMFVTTVFTGTAVLRHRKSDIGEWFMSLILAATLYGLGSIAFGVSRNFRVVQSAYGTVVASGGFNGAFLHPNSHTVYASLFVAFLILIWVLSTYRRTWLAAPLLACWFLFIAWSAARGAVVASALAILAAVVYASPFRNRLGWFLRPNVRRGTLVGIGVVVTIAAIMWNAATGGSLGKSLVSFINKGGEEKASLDTETILSSRRAILEASLENFRQSPVFGIGFGVAKTEQFQRMATLFTAPAEKGFLPTAILEEGGVIGTAAFLLFIGTFLWELRRERNIAGIVVFTTFLFTNVGEVTIFAPGGAGAFGWISVGAAMVLGDHCWRPPRRRWQPRAVQA